VLCPGLALPLHVFEERYRLMIGRCLDRSMPFGVVLIRDGREVGAAPDRVADVGTTAVIRQAGRYADGRLDIVTVGERRFRIERLETTREPYLVGVVSLLDEAIGADLAITERLSAHVGGQFLRYLELLRVRIEETAVPTPRDHEPIVPDALGTTDDEPGATDDLDDRQRADRLLASARRLVDNGDATAVSYLLTGLVQVELATRQDLLEAPDTMCRLERLDVLLNREIQLLRRHLRPLAVDPRMIELRRN
jgi:Lon protease-like protein